MKKVCARSLRLPLSLFYSFTLFLSLSLSLCFSRTRTHARPYWVFSPQWFLCYVIVAFSVISLSQNRPLSFSFAGRFKIMMMYGWFWCRIHLESPQLSPLSLNVSVLRPPAPPPSLPSPASLEQGERSHAPPLHSWPRACSHCQSKDWVVLLLLNANLGR